MPKGKPWTEEEVYYLQDNWGSVSIKGIANKLNRSFDAVKQKSQKMGLGDPRLHYDGLTVNQLASVLNVEHRTLRNWIKLYDFPARFKLFSRKERTLVVSYEDFWKWAEANKNMLDFSKIERLSIGPEPEWVEEKRKADQLKNLHVPRTHNTPWSKRDDARLKQMLKQFKYTYPEIAGTLKRSQVAVKKRIRDLGLKERPVRLPNHTKYTPEVEQQLVDMLGKGYSFEVIASRLNKSSLGVRGKAERMGYKFKNGVPYLEDNQEAK